MCGRGEQREGVRSVLVSAPTYLGRKFRPQMRRRGRDADVIWVWVGALGRHFCPRQSKRTQADEMGGVALITIES